MTNDNFNDDFVKPFELENKKDIFYRLINSKDYKEKGKILENFWLNEKREPKENIKIIRNGINLLDKGTDKEKIIALQVISRTEGFPLSDRFEEIFGEESIKKNKDIETVSYDELNEVVEKCIKFLTNENGNLRLAAANTLNHLKIHISKAESIKIYNRIVKLRDTIKDKRRKTIEYCIDKIMPFEIENLFEDIDPEVKKIWKENEILAEELGDAYYDSILKESEEFIKKDTKENIGYNMFVDGIRVGLDIIMPLLNEKMQGKVKHKIEQMLTKRNLANEIGDELWSEGSYMKPINLNDPLLDERMKYFEERFNEKKEYNCKKCNKAIGKHNLYWHEGMCNDCFFDEYNM